MTPTFFKAALRSATCLTLAAFAGSTAAYAQDGSQSQQTAQEESADANAIVVTGSRIRRDTFNSASPITVITRDDSTRAGFNSTTEILQSSGVTAGARQIDNTFGGYVVDGGPGVNTLSLRGLGATRSLILLNGRRIAPSGTRGAVGAADLNVLPNAIVERIEVLKDGASSIYGSDAVAGVVNIITNKKTEGLTLEGGVTVPEVGSGVTQRIAVVGGYSSDRFNFAGAFEFFKRTNMTLADQPWARCQTEYLRSAAGQPWGSGDFIDPLTGAAKCYPTGATGLNGVTVNTIGTSTRTGAAGGPGNAAIGTFNRFRPNPAAAGSVPGWEGVNGGGSLALGNRDTYNQMFLQQSLISPVKTYNGFFQASYDLHGLGNAEIYFEGLFNRRQSAQSGFRQLALDYYRGSPLIPAELQFSNQAGTQLTPTTTYNPTGRMGVRVFTSNTYDSRQTADFMRLGGGIRGELPFGGWRYDLYAGTSKSDAKYTTELFITDRLIQSLDVVSNGAGGFVCRNTANGCVAAPAISAAFVGGAYPADWKNFVQRPVTGTTKFWEDTFALGLDGNLFKLPYGDVGVSLGLEHRRQRINDTPGIEMQTAQVYNFSTAGITKGKDSVTEVFGEVEVPLLRGLPFAEEVTINASARYTDYKSYGSDWTYKFSGVWTPLRAVSFRATYGSSYRAPALYEQFQAPTAGFLSSNSDPCNLYGEKDPTSTIYKNCQADGVPVDYGVQPGPFPAQSIRSLQQGGAATGLAAETSTNWTLGLVLQPELPAAIGNIEFAVDFYNIKVEDGVSQLGTSSILSSCYNDPEFKNGNLGGELCRLITRDSGTSTNPYQLTVQNGFVNISVDKVRGLEYTLRWTRDLGPGKLRLNALATQYLDQADKTFPTDPLYDNNGNIYYPKWTGTFSANYQIKDWTLFYGVNWVGKMDSYAAVDEDPATSVYKFNTPNYFTHDASVSWQSEKFELTAGVRNLTNKRPPQISGYVYNRIGNAPLYSGYDFRGRTFFMNITAKVF